MINKNGLILIKQEAQKLNRNNEIQANIIYKKIWDDIILQYILTSSTHNTFIFWLDDYIKKNRLQILEAYVQDKIDSPITYIIYKSVKD